MVRTGVKGPKKSRKNGAKGTALQYLPHSAPPRNGNKQIPQQSEGSHPAPAVYSGPYYNPSDNQAPIKGRHNVNCLLVCLVVLSYCATIVLGIFVLVGCISTTASVDSLYLTELTRNKTYDIKLRVGYFGGCISIANISGGASPVSNNSTNISGSHCIMTMRGQDMDDLTEEFWENLSLTATALAEVKDLLNITLPQAKHLQDDVFFWQPPALHVVLFFISGIVLFVCLASSSPRRPYKSVLVIASLVGAFALALSLVTVIGSLQALNTLMAGDSSANTKSLIEDVVISRADRLDRLQKGVAATASIFYIVIGIIFVQRRPEGEKLFSTFPNRIRFMSRRGS